MNRNYTGKQGTNNDGKKEYDWKLENRENKKTVPVLLVAALFEGSYLCFVILQGYRINGNSDCSDGVWQYCSRIRYGCITNLHLIHHATDSRRPSKFLGIQLDVARIVLLLCSIQNFCGRPCRNGSRWSSEPIVSSSVYRCSSRKIDFL